MNSARSDLPQKSWYSEGMTKVWGTKSKCL